ncbi:decaprenyl-phosphate phosphoribosyltransferase [Umezawaea endophytica]|uniref:Decaprenyl-phosphate phosphoribosyltransferase n=1 Tax=Umezawaea endophytica TaxID=1654476 RepID=A0A9X3ALP3_9PSEU|nr:decaprenyl-phosphate phosphoribosyltransferase [Umezawaea endophytica]MCS7484785.1 decaprenyl-phosphate phosphoribosyltransferase [Umezawaea endophytica]
MTVAVPADVRPAPWRTFLGLVRTARPHQWTKNVLVLAAPFTSTRIFEADVLRSAALAFVAFCLAASSIYLVNDAKDVLADREHPKKRLRPIAAGVVPVPLAYGAAVALMLGSLAVAAAANWTLVVIVAVYLVVQLGYCLGLKHQPVLELCIVASGFLLRCIAGGVAADIVPSQWFLLVTAFGSLFIVAGKRYAEIKLYQSTGAAIRHSLTKYSETYLRFVWATSAAVMNMTYGLWAFEISQRTHNSWGALSMVPFVIAVLRYAVDVDSGKAGAPDDLARTDHVLQVLGLVWLGTLTLAIYV